MADNQRKHRVLLMYISRVSGHHQATVAIQRALHQLSHEVEAPAINGFGYAYPRLEKIINRAYMGIIKRSPKIWDYLYDNPKVFKRSQSIKKFLNKSSHKKIEKLLKRYHPDTVVCTQAFPCGMVADYKVTHGVDIKIIGVLTDYAPHSYWINEGVDYYVVPSADSKERFIKKGVDPDKIKVYGIPIRPKFAEQLDKLPIAVKLGLDLNTPTVLLMGGGQGLGPIQEAVKSLLCIDKDLQMIVITGINKKLSRWLDKIEPIAGKKLVHYEYVNNVDELMEVASLIVTKPGGMTTTECLAKGLPMVIVNPLPGQEMRNTDFLLEKGIAIRIDDTADIGEEIRILLDSPEKLNAMRQAAFANARPHAALDIARLILHGREEAKQADV